MCVSERGPDPNEGSTDPMVQEYWHLGEDVQNRILAAGYESDMVEGIAVDIHDVLQAADRIRDELSAAVTTAQTPDELVLALQGLGKEFEHIRWHCESADSFLRKALAVLQPSHEQPL